LNCSAALALHDGGKEARSIMSEHRDQRGMGKDEPGSQVDRASADSFPASDPPARTGVTGAGEPAKKPLPPLQGGDADAQPTGTPTSDRNDTETAHQRQDQEGPDTPARGRG
jgi:hypothetical protein